MGATAGLTFDTGTVAAPVFLTIKEPHLGDLADLRHGRTISPSIASHHFGPIEPDRL
jgi:hypothetical protein